MSGASWGDISFAGVCAALPQIAPAIIDDISLERYCSCIIIVFANFYPVYFFGSVASFSGVVVKNVTLRQTEHRRHILTRFFCCQILTSNRPHEHQDLQFSADAAYT